MADLPTACAVGFILPPLRGSVQFASLQNPGASGVR